MGILFKIGFRWMNSCEKVKLMHISEDNGKNVWRFGRRQIQPWLGQ